MIFIQDTFVEESILTEHFHCNIQACLGQCCQDGDFGAPLEKLELTRLEEAYPKVKSFLSDENQNCIETKGMHVEYPSEKMVGTPLLENGLCAYASVDEIGIISCGLEKAFNLGLVEFKKPISCELYPIRIEKHPQNNCDILRYDKWEICKPACHLGQEKKLKIYQFLKAPLIRKYGQEYFELLDAYAKKMMV